MSGRVESKDPARWQCKWPKNVKLSISYHYSESLSFGLDYIYEKFSSSDWHLDEVEPNTIPNLLALGADAWNYDTSVVYFNVRYQLR